jgi:hypothetical protein
MLQLCCHPGLRCCQPAKLGWVLLGERSIRRPPRFGAFSNILEQIEKLPVKGISM